MRQEIEKAIRSEIVIVLELVLELVLVLGLFIIDARHAVSPIRFPRSPTRRSADPFLLACIRIPSNCPKGSARSFQPRGSVPKPEAYVLCQELLTDPNGAKLRAVWDVFGEDVFERQEPSRAGRFG